MSTSNLVKCTCCDADVEEEQTVVDQDLKGPVCIAYCKEALQWAHAYLRRRTAQGVSITGIHGPREKSIPYDPKISEEELRKLDEAGEQ